MFKNVAAALTIIFLAACGGDTEPTAASLAGTWTLQSVNGAAVPTTISGSGANRTDVTSGTVILTAASTYTQTVNVVTYISGQQSTSTPSDAGSFSLSGSTLTFSSSSGGSPQTATVSGGTLSMNFQGYAVVYVKK